MAIDYSHWRGKPKRACFGCRKCFKDPSYYHAREKDRKCPHCGGALHNMGTHFKAPKRSDDKAWEALEMLYANGVRFAIFDWHIHCWPEVYKEHGMNYQVSEFGNPVDTKSYLRSVLGNIGIRVPRETDPEEEKPRAEITERFAPHDLQWQGGRPTHPRDVPAYLEWWRKQGFDRIAIAVEACEQLGYEPPVGLRGELLLEEMRKKFDFE